MTTFTSADHFVVIYCADEWDPTTRGGVTGIAIIRGIDVRVGFADGHYTVVTTDASADDFIMINRRGRYRNPWGRCKVTGFTDIRRIDMHRTLTRGRYAIVTAETRLTHGRAVIKAAHKPI